MKFTPKLLIVFCLTSLLLANLATYAQQPTVLYTIQIGAYLYPPADLLASTEKFGKVIAKKTRGLTHISVGSFNNREDAQVLLSQIKQSGHSDAFIVLLNNESTSIKQASAEPVSEMEKFRLLSDADKAKAIFYNGKLHFKENDQFIPVP